MKLNIVKPTQKKTVDIQWIDIQTSVGNFVIQDDHAPMILTLKQNSEVIYSLLTSEQITEKVTYGFIHIERKIVTLLLNQ